MRGIALREYCHKLSTVAYRDDVEIHSFGGIDIYREYHDDTDTTFLAFAGSNETFDWFRGFHFFPKRTAFGKAHRGYYNKIKAHRLSIMALVKPESRLVLTGHSKGGAEAQLFAAMMPHLNIAAVVTFGAPKPIKKLFSPLHEQQLRDRTTNYVNPNDGFTRVPLGWDRIGKDVVKSFTVYGSEHPLACYAEFFVDV